MICATRQQGPVFQACLSRVHDVDLTEVYNYGQLERNEVRARRRGVGRSGCFLFFRAFCDGRRE